MALVDTGLEARALSRRRFLIDGAAVSGLLFTPAIARARGLSPADFGNDLKAWAAAAAPKYLPSGVYEVSDMLRFDGRFNIDCAANATIVASDFFKGDRVASIIGPRFEISGLQADVYNGARILQFAAPHRLSAGDALIFEDQTEGTFWPFIPVAGPRRYRAGGFARVAAVLDSLRVTLQEPLRVHSVSGGLPAAQTRIWRLPNAPAPVNIGLKVNARHKARAAMHIDSLLDFNLNSVVANAGLDYGLWMERCVAGVIKDAVALCDSPARGSQYGLAIVSSNKIEVSGGYFFSTRHAITVSGGGGGFDKSHCRPPSDETTISNAQMVSTHAQAADISHAPNVRTSFIECDASGLAWGGADGRWIGGTIRTSPGPNDSCLFASEMVSANALVAPRFWHYDLDGTSKYFKAVIDFDGSGRAVDKYLHKGGLISISGEVIAPKIDLTRQPLIKLRNAGYLGGVAAHIGIHHYQVLPALVSVVRSGRAPLDVRLEDHASALRIQVG